MQKLWRWNAATKEYKTQKNATVGTRKSCLQLEKEVVAPNDEEMEQVGVVDLYQSVHSL